MQEEWKSIEGFEQYVVSNYGYIMNTKSGRMMRRSAVQYGMLTVCFAVAGEQSRRSISGIVARAFLDPPRRYDYDTPIHLDGDRSNCRSDNLEWRPRWFAINYHMERRKPPFPGWSRDIRLVQTGEVFSCPGEAAVKYGLLERTIHESLVNGTFVFPNKFTFIYDD